MPQRRAARQEGQPLHNRFANRVLELDLTAVEVHDTRRRIGIEHGMQTGPAQVAFNQKRPKSASGGLRREAAKQTHFEESYVYTPQCRAEHVTDLNPDPTLRFASPDFGTIKANLDLRRRW